MGVDYYGAGDYETAVSYFEKIPDSSCYSDDSLIMISQCFYDLGKEYMNNGQYREAADYFLSVCDFADAQERAEECYYNMGLEQQADNDFGAAAEEFCPAGDYGDAESRDAVCSSVLTYDDVWDGYQDNLNAGIDTIKSFLPFEVTSVDIEFDDDTANPQNMTVCMLNNDPMWGFAYINGEYTDGNEGTDGTRIAKTITVIEYVLESESEETGIIKMNLYVSAVAAMLMQINEYLNLDAATFMVINWMQGMPYGSKTPLGTFGAYEVVGEHFYSESINGDSFVFQFTLQEF